LESGSNEGHFQDEAASILKDIDEFFILLAKGSVAVPTYRMFNTELYKCYRDVATRLRE